VGEKVLEIQGSPAVETFIIVNAGSSRKNTLEVNLEPNTASIKYALTLGSSRSDGYFSARVSNGELGYTFNNRHTNSLKEMAEMMLDWIAERRTNI
jgi:hypothetical protein